MTINPCDCGQLFLPKGDRYSPNNGLRIRVVTEDSYYDDTLLHNVDVLISADQLFLTLTPRIYHEAPLYAKNIIVYLGSNTVISPTVVNSVQLIIKAKETGEVLVNKVIGALGDYSSLQRNELVDNSFAFTFIETDILNAIDLNEKTLQLEIYSLCDNDEAGCCDKLPSNMYLYNVRNINCSTTTSTTTSTTNTTPLPPTTTTSTSTTTTTTTTSTTSTTTSSTTTTTGGPTTTTTGGPTTTTTGGPTTTTTTSEPTTTTSTTSTTTTTTTTTTSTTTTTTSTTPEPGCNWDGNGSIEFTGDCTTVINNIPFTRNEYSWTATLQLNCSPNTITGTVYCDPAEYIDPMNINAEECVRKWSGSVSMSCGSVNITGNDGNCSNNHPPRFNFDVDFNGCPDNCCPDFPGLNFILLYENCGSFSSNNGELQQILSIPSNGIIYITGDFYNTENPGLVDSYAYFSVIGDSFSEAEPYPGSFGTGWSWQENYTRLRNVTAGENIYIQADYNTTFSTSRCLRIWFSPSQE